MKTDTEKVGKSYENEPLALDRVRLKIQSFQTQLKPLSFSKIKSSEKDEQINLPGSLGSIAGVSEAEFAGEDGLSDITLDLKHLRTTLRLAVELKHESRVGFGLNIQMKLGNLRTGALNAFADGDPPVVEHTSLTLGSRQIQRDRNPAQKPPGVNPTGSAPPPRVDCDFEAEFPGEDGLRRDPVQIRLAEMEGGGSDSEAGISV